MPPVNQIKKLEGIESTQQSGLNSGLSYLSSDEQRLQNGESIFRLDAEKRAQNSNGNEKSDNSKKPGGNWLNKLGDALSSVKSSRGDSRNASDNSVAASASMDETVAVVDAKAATAVSELGNNNMQLNALANNTNRANADADGAEADLADANARIEEANEQIEEAENSNPFAGSIGQGTDSAYSVQFAGDLETGEQSTGEEDSSLLSTATVGASGQVAARDNTGNFQNDNTSNSKINNAKAEIADAVSDAEVAQNTLDNSNSTVASNNTRSSSLRTENRATQGRFTTLANQAHSSISGNEQSAQNDLKAEQNITFGTQASSCTGQIGKSFGDALASCDKTKEIGIPISAAGSGVISASATTEGINQASQGNTIAALQNAGNAAGSVSSSMSTVKGESKDEDGTKDSKKDVKKPEPVQTDVG